MKLLVTGGAGFIGSNFVTLLLDHTDHEPVVLDALTYAGKRENLPAGVELIEGRIEDREIVSEAMAGVDAVINFAAESHVDRSIMDQSAFIQSNIVGTSVLLDAARAAGVGRYVQISTDEVYGSISEGSFTEHSPLRPSSPYSASKAAADLLVQSHVRTHGLDAVIIRASNNYGPRQDSEKLIPMTISRALQGESIPIYGAGDQVRNWLYVGDFCRAILAVLEGGKAGEIYNAGGPDEVGNLALVTRLLELVNQGPQLIEFVADRLGHDQRYSLDSSKLRGELGWQPKVRLIEGLKQTVSWYRLKTDLAYL